MNMKRKGKVVIFCIVLSFVVVAACSIIYITYITKNRNTEKYEERDNVVSVTMQEIAENTKWQANVKTFRLLVENYYSNTNRGIEFEETDTENGKTYVLKISLHNNSDEERMQFCREVRDCMEECFEVLSYEENKELYSYIIVDYAGDEQKFLLGELLNAENYDGTEVYNELYLFLEQMTLGRYEEQCAEASDKKNFTKNEVKAEQEISTEQEGQEETVEQTEGQDGVEVSEEIRQIYLSREPECTYTMSDGTEYGLVLADRACGSSYYVLISTEDGGKVINLSPHNGSGGQALWLTFLEDEQIGFTGLAYSGGSKGSLYRTEDGGKSFTNVEYPSAKIQLPDGTYYNPFIMPERVYEENGKLYMEAGQGPDGDYYGEEGYCAGLYESTDLGKTWIYVKEIPVSR